MTEYRSTNINVADLLKYLAVLKDCRHVEGAGDCIAHLELVIGPADLAKFAEDAAETHLPPTEDDLTVPNPADDLTVPNPADDLTVPNPADDLTVPNPAPDAVGDLVHDPDSVIDDLTKPGLSGGSPGLSGGSPGLSGGSPGLSGGDPKFVSGDLKDLL